MQRTHQRKTSAVDLRPPYALAWTSESTHEHARTYTTQYTLMNAQTEQDYQSLESSVSLIRQEAGAAFPGTAEGIQVRNCL